MPKLLFRGAFIRFVDLRYDEKSKTTYTKINFTASFSEPIREAMEWGEPPAGFASADLDGQMAATHLILTPNGRELKQHELQLDAKEISAFKLVRVEDENETTHNELRFQVATTSADAAALLSQYLSTIGKGEGQLRVNYDAQSEMDLAEDADQQERLISDEQAADTAEAGPSLAPALLVGGTHQRGTRGRPPRNRSGAEPIQISSASVGRHDPGEKTP